MSDQTTRDAWTSPGIAMQSAQPPNDVGLLDMARALLAVRREGGVERERTSGDGIVPRGAVVETSAGRSPVEREASRGRDPFEHLRIAQRQAARDLERFYRDAKRRHADGVPMDASDFSKAEKGIVDRMGPDGPAVARRIRRDLDVRRSARRIEGRARVQGVVRGRDVVTAMAGLAKGPSMPVPLPIAVLARGLGVGR